MHAPALPKRGTERHCKPCPQKLNKHRKIPAQTCAGILYDLLLDLFDLCRLTGTAAQIVQLRPAHFALADNGDVRDLGGMHGERPLDAYAVRKPPNRKGFADAAVLFRYHDAFERLQSLARALDDLYADLNGVAYVESGNAVFEILFQIGRASCRERV